MQHIRISSALLHNYQKYSSLEQPPLIGSLFCRSEIQTWQDYFFCSRSLWTKSQHHWAAFSSELGFFSRLTCLIQCLTAGGRRAHFFFADCKLRGIVLFVTNTEACGFKRKCNSIAGHDFKTIELILNSERNTFPLYSSQAKPKEQLYQMRT